MKRHPALQNISREHQHTLSLAQRIIRAVKADDIDAMNGLKSQVSAYYEEELKSHFEKEEGTFFHIVSQYYPELQALANTYLEEHKQLSELAMQMDEASSSEQLEAFALLLKSHTRNEERELFPLLESRFTESQFQQVMVGTSS